MHIYTSKYKDLGGTIISSHSEKEWILIGQGGRKPLVYANFYSLIQLMKTTKLLHYTTLNSTKRELKTDVKRKTLLLGRCLCLCLGEGANGVKALGWLMHIEICGASSPSCFYSDLTVTLLLMLCIFTIITALFTVLEFLQHPPPHPTPPPGFWDLLLR